MESWYHNGEQGWIMLILVLTVIQLKTRLTTMYFLLDHKCFEVQPLCCYYELISYLVYTGGKHQNVNVSLVLCNHILSLIRLNISYDTVIIKYFYLHSSFLFKVLKCVSKIKDIKTLIQVKDKKLFSLIPLPAQACDEHPVVFLVTYDSMSVGPLC